MTEVQYPLSGVNYVDTVGTVAIQTVTGLNERDMHFLCRHEWLGLPLNEGSGNRRKWLQWATAVACTYAVLRRYCDMIRTHDGCYEVGVFTKRYGLDRLSQCWLVVRENHSFVTDDLRVLASHETSTVVSLQKIAEQVETIFAREKETTQ